MISIAYEMEPEVLEPGNTNAPEGKYRAAAVALRSKDLDAENTLAEPTRMAPRQREAKSVGRQFQWEMEGNSFTVLTLTPESR
jgi:hypothetical protein